jgi:phage terminase small subunit
MTAKPLTVKQERFAQLVAEGMTQADAYRQAYNAAKMKPETIWARASELMADSNVSGRVETLRAQMAAATVKRTARTREQLLEKLDRVFTDAMDAEANNGRKAHSAAVSAVATQSKMLGFDIQKLEVTGDIELRGEFEMYLQAKKVADELTEGQICRASIASVHRAMHQVPEEVAGELVSLLRDIAKVVAKTKARDELVKACQRVLSDLEGYVFD